MADDLTIGQVAERTGLSADTLRFYEREGILANPVRRRAGGQRVYSEDDVGWLVVCTILRDSGMPIPQVRRYTELVRAGEHTAAERLDLLRAHQVRVQEQMTALNRCQDLITYKIGVYEDILDARTATSAGAPSA